MNKYYSFITFFLFLNHFSNAQNFLDKSFDEDGKFIFSNFYGQGNDVLIQPDGKILIGGYSPNSGWPDFMVIRLLPNGTRDSAFGTNGIVLQNISNSDNGNAILLQPDGKIILGGTFFLSNSGFCLYRLNADGSLDTDFGTNGRSIVDPSTNHEFLISIALRSNGKIVLAGNARVSSAQDIIVAQVNSNGTLDTEFGTNGYVSTSVNAWDETKDVQLLSDGKIVVCGFTYTGVSTTDGVLVQYNTNGTLNTDFSSDGKMTFSLGDESLTSFSALSVESEDKIILAGASKGDDGNDYITLTRVLSDGIMDNTFGDAGVTVVDEFANDYSRDMIKGSDGYYYVCSGSGFLRVNASGVFDETFGASGRISEYNDGMLYRMAIQSDGKLIGVGSLSDVNSTKFLVKRYWPYTPPNVLFKQYAFSKSNEVGYSIGTIEVTEHPEDASYTFEIISGNDEGLFSMNSATGELTVANSLSGIEPGFIALEIKITENNDDYVYTNSNTIHLSILNTTAVVNVAESESAFHVYPNPANTHITVRSTSTDPLSYRLFSIDGQLIGAIEANSDEVLLPACLPGFYLLEIEQNDRHYYKQLTIVR